MQYFPDRFVRREIQGLEVNCKFQNEGCNWEGTYGDLPSHLNTCKYALLGMKLCPFQPLGCSNKSSMNDDELREHLRESEYDHLTVIVNYYRLLSEKVNKLQGRSLMRDNCVEADGADTGYETMDMPGYDRVPVSYYDQVEKDGSATSVVEKGTRGSPQSLAMKPLYRATLEVPNALSTSQLREMMDREMEDLREKVMSSTMERLQSKDEEIASLRTQITKLEKQIRSKNAELEDRDFRLSLIENSNHDGSMIWKIPQFSQRKADAENGKYTSIFSLPFYSGRYGYKMCLRLYIMGDGIGKGTHLSLFFVVMRGEFDNILQWPFTHKVTFKLINQAGGRDIVDTCPLLTLDELRHQWLKDRLHDFLWLQRVRRQEKSLECRTTAPLDVRWMEFQCLLLLTYGDVERNPGPLTSKSALIYLEHMLLIIPCD